ncbi:MAG: F0F1 ATP synthase subunit A [Clostridiales bacterium]|jgi:F-type H+-transporting ATPase subunit a|nr:F0F1 ATP synthase subunit A [Clostridiales bacterium]
MNFSNRNLWPLFRFGDETIYITDTMRGTWIIMAVLIVLAVIVRLKARRFVESPAPNSFQNLVELMVESMDQMAKSNMGQELAPLGAYFFGVFAFILISNYAGLFGFRPPTADLATTLSFALNTFFLIHFLGISRRGGKYFKDYLHPNVIFLPINIIGEIARPISLSFRLFGNILGGVIILGMLYAALPVLLRFILPDALHFYFDMFAGSLQAFIFTVLSMTFIREKAVSEEE